jgi:hypothetical protein
MALDNAALLEVLEAMQAAGVEDRVRTATEAIYQALIDAELTAVIGAGPWERSPEQSAQRKSRLCSSQTRPFRDMPSVVRRVAASRRHRRTMLLSAALLTAPIADRHDAAERRIGWMYTLLDPLASRCRP